jgi:DNA-binding beta-propeller fold protein YncE
LLAVGVAGKGLTTTVVDPAALGHPPTVIVTLYVPASVGSTLVIVGFRTAEVKPLGPVQLYVAPATRGVDRFSVWPVHKGPLLVAVGVAGNGLTTTVVDPAALGQPPTVIVTLYVPASVGSTLVIVGFRTAEVNPPGPVQLYVAPATRGVERLSVAPVHKGPLLVAVGVAGKGLTTTVVDPAALGQPLTVIVTLYVPASVGSTLVIVGFRTAEVKPLGPVQL